MKLGLVLAGGGARGAYQIEVWKALAKLKIDKYIKVVSGISIGVLNTIGQSDGCKQCPALLCECEDSGTGRTQAGTPNEDSGAGGGSHQPGTGQPDFRLPRHLGECIL